VEKEKESNIAFTKRYTQLCRFFRQIEKCVKYILFRQLMLLHHDLCRHTAKIIFLLPPQKRLCKVFHKTLHWSCSALRQ